MDNRVLDVIVVGGGISGIAFARFYLEANSNSQLVVLEREDGPGGVWSRARAYPGFWSQTGLGMTEFSDKQMVVPPDAKLIYNLPEASLITDYLEQYCDSHDYNGITIRDRMVFDCEVQTISKFDGLWYVQVVTKDGQKTLRAPKLVMASGLYTMPNIPDLPGVKKFEGKIIHQKDFGRSHVLDSPDVEHILVMGGAKSAGDIAYASAKAGKIVSWVLRESGAGTFSDPKGIGWYRNAPEIASTRLISLLTPSMFTPQTLISRFCHGTALGRSLMRTIFTSTDRATLALGNFRSRKGARQGFEKLESNPDYFWLNGFVGMAQQPDFWETIAAKVDVYKSDITNIEGDTVTLKDGSSIQADAILCGTGFNRSFSLFQRPTAADLGLPVPLDMEAKELADWSKLEKEADDDIVQRFIGLADPPTPRKPTTTPYRLYNLMASLTDDSVVFLGYLGVLNAFYTAECQAIWATAYLDKKLILQDIDERTKNTAYVNAFSKRRYPFLGQDGAAINYDMVGYCDHLLKQVGLRSHIDTSWWAYWFGVCNASTLANIKDEYLKLHSGSKDSAL